MRPVAIFYHIYMGGGSIPCDHDNVLGIVTDQLSSMRVCGVMAKADQVTVGVSGSDLDAFMVRGMIGKGSVVHHASGNGELPTMILMQFFCKTHPGWDVLYLHTKGAIYKGFQHVVDWRHCMERAVLWNWQSCVKDMESGVDSCGAHWLTPWKYPVIGPVPYWGGNFFWVKSEFVNTLPPLDPNADRYAAEVWIGRGKKPPRVRDYAAHWPGQGCH